MTRAKRQFVAAAAQYKLAADLGCAVGIFHCAHLLRLGLSAELLPDGTLAVNYDAAMQHLTKAMQQEQRVTLGQEPLLPQQQQQRAGTSEWGTPADWDLALENVGVAECHIVAGDMQRDGLWGVSPASTPDALATYKKAAQPQPITPRHSSPPHPAALAAIVQLYSLLGNPKAAIEYYRIAANQGYSLGELGVAKLLAEGAEVEGHPAFHVQLDKEAALDGALLAAKHGLSRAKALAATLEPDKRKAAALLLQAVEEDGHPQCLLLAAQGYGYARYGLPK
jgi:TPR repeat protein